MLNLNKIKTSFLKTMKTYSNVTKSYGYTHLVEKYAVKYVKQLYLFSCAFSKGKYK